MKNKFKIKNKFIRIPLGILCILIGIIGGFIPIFQGWVFVVLGCTILFGEKFIKKWQRKK